MTAAVPLSGAQDPDAPDGIPGSRRLTAPMIAMGLAVFAGAASMRCLDAVLPTLAAGYGRSVGATGAAVSAYAFSYSAGQLLSGPVGDRLSAYRVVACATGLSALAAAACALATSLTALVVLRFVAGSTAAAIGPMTLVWLARTAAPQERAVAFARMGSAAILGTAAGQVGGGVVSGMMGWSAIFVAISAAFAVSSVILVFLSRRKPTVVDSRRRATAIPARSLIALVLRPAVAAILVAVGLQGIALHFSIPYVGALIEDRLSLGPSRTGLIVCLYGAGGLAFVLLAPRLIRSASAAGRAAAGGSIMAAGFAYLGFAWTQIDAAASLFAIGFGFMLLHNVLQVEAARMAPDALGASVSLFAAASCIGQSIGAAGGGIAFDWVGGTAQCMISAAGFVALGIGIATAMRPR